MLPGGGYLEYPLAQPADQGGMRQIHDRPIEPEMHCRDRRGVQARAGLGQGNLLEQLGPEQFAELLPRDGRDDVVEAAAGPIGQHDAKETLAIDFQPLDPRAHVELCAAAGEPYSNALPDLAQRYPGDEELIGLARGHEPIDEYFSRRRNRQMIDGIAQSAFQNQGPEPPQGVFRLLLATQPLANGGRVGQVGLAMTRQSPHGPADCPALAAREVSEPLQSGS